MMILKRQLSWMLMLGIIVGPTAVGIFPLFPTVVVQAALVALCLYAFSSSGSSTRTKRSVLALLSICFAITIGDLLGRPVLFVMLEDRPRDVFAHTVPELPLIYRFTPNVNLKGATFGDLAAMSGKKDWREPRVVEFQTDAFGFRNASLANDQPLDLIVLGDSYGVGDGTSQEKTWPRLLATEQHLAVYNLSMDGASPWQEYVNLLLEGEKLKTRDGATVLWLLFTGNDLIDPCYPAFKPADLPWLHRLGSFLNRIRTFRFHSPLRRILFLRGQHSDRDDVVARTLPDGRTILFNRAYAQLAVLSLDEVVHHKNYENVRSSLAAMKRLTDERHLKLVVAVAPSKEEVYDWVLNQQEHAPAGNNAATKISGFAMAMKNLSEENGIAFLDLKPALVEAARNAYQQSGELLWWRDDTHWNEAGHRAAATILYEKFLQPAPSRAVAVTAH
jgi:lysophospholipase L1-like esterase